MNRYIIFRLSIVFLLLLFVSCKQTKYVSDGDYLLKKNKVHFVEINGSDTLLVKRHENIDAAIVAALIKPHPNSPLKLFMYNRIDTTKHKLQFAEKEDKYREKEKRRLKKEKEINLRRITKGENKGDSLYRHKVIRKKEAHFGWRDKYLNIFGQAPILLDTSRTEKSQKQIEIYLLQKGFYNAQVADTIIYDDKKAELHFHVISGQPYRIRNITLDSNSFVKNISKGYNEVVLKEGEIIHTGDLLDQNLLNQERERLAKYYRNAIAMFGFSKNQIGFLVDTTVGYLQADITYFVKPKLVNELDVDSVKTLVEIPYHAYRIRSVQFNIYNSNEASFKNFEGYKMRCDSLAATGFFMPDTLGIDYRIDGRYPLLDTLNLEATGEGLFLYNEFPGVNPHLLDKQNFLEMDMRHAGGKKRFYKDRYVEMSYAALFNLGVFSNIAVHINIDPANKSGNFVVVEYDLFPSKAQSFLAAPRVTNTNGVFGIEGQLSYLHKNIFKKAQRVEFSIIGGVESQPLIVGEQGDEHRIWKLNTFEVGIKASLTVPKIMPFGWLISKGNSKRAYPKTTIEISPNYQIRSEFSRVSFKAELNWNFKIPKTWAIDLSGIGINFINLNKTDLFQTQLENLNNPFLLNAYADHFAVMTSGTIHYSNLNANRRKNKHLHDVKLGAIMSGKALTPLIYNKLSQNNNSSVGVNAAGLKTVFGVPYSEFFKITGQYIAKQHISTKHQIAYRAFAGLGLAKGNSLVLPYEYAFFAGGSNDIRAFAARSMAPGSYKTYAEENASITQIGDIKFEANIEWRFDMNDLLEGALFIDAGNIWNHRQTGISADDPTVLKSSSWREVAVGFGYGIRADFDFLIVRIDLAIALHNPHLPATERWIWEKKTTYKSTAYFEYNTDTKEYINYESPHKLVVNFGIGYPF
ncbi:MAG: BamA/TamA family outer membrane protein [Crocinitomix sp.]|nr:BamA/TamA family outer membrane protein [Crocinitomix sp.]